MSTYKKHPTEEGVVIETTTSKRDIALEEKERELADVVREKERVQDEIDRIEEEIKAIKTALEIS